MAEYEALLLGFNLAVKHEIKLLSVFGDSELIVSEVRSKYPSKQQTLKKYKNTVWTSIECLMLFQLIWWIDPKT